MAGFVQELPIVRLLFEGGDYSRAGSIRRNAVYSIMESRYSENKTFLMCVIAPTRELIVAYNFKLFHIELDNTQQMDQK